MYTGKEREPITSLNKNLTLNFLLYDCKPEPQTVVPKHHGLLMNSKEW